MASPKNPVTGRFVRTLPAYAKGGTGKCRAPGCDRMAQAFSYYCNTHVGKLKRTGSIDGRIPAQSEVKPYADTVRVAFDMGLDRDERVQALFAWFDAAIRVRCGDERHQRQLNRLLSAGVTGQEMAERVLGVVGLQSYFYGSGEVCEGFRELSPENYRVAIGSAWLRTVPMPRRPKAWPSGKDRGEKAPSAAVLKAFGDKVVDQILGPLLQTWRAALAMYEAEQCDPLSVYFRDDPLRPDGPRIVVGDANGRQNAYRRQRIRRDLPPGHVTKLTTQQAAPLPIVVEDFDAELDGLLEQRDRDHAAKLNT